MSRDELSEMRASVRFEVFSLEACSRCGVVTNDCFMKRLSSDELICHSCVSDQDLVAEETQWAGGAD